MTQCACVIAVQISWSESSAEYGRPSGIVPRRWRCILRTMSQVRSTTGVDPQVIALTNDAVRPSRASGSSL